MVSMWNRCWWSARCGILVSSSYSSSSGTTNYQEYHQEIRFTVADVPECESRRKHNSESGATGGKQGY